MPIFSTHQSWGLWKEKKNKFTNVYRLLTDWSLKMFKPMLDQKFLQSLTPLKSPPTMLSGTLHHIQQQQQQQQHQLNNSSSSKSSSAQQQQLIQSQTPSTSSNVSANTSINNSAIQSIIRNRNHWLESQLKPIRTYLN